jgi:hypothetical protein
MIRSVGAAAVTTAGMTQITSVLANDSEDDDVCPIEDLVTLDDDAEGGGDDDTEDDDTDSAEETVTETTDGQTVETFTIQEGTEYATQGYVIDGPTSGPTGVVLGGVHGNEVSGYRAANAIVDWDVTQGTLIVVPEANAVAVGSGTRYSPSGDLNRQFPTGSEPTTPLAREIWELITGADANVVIDLHTSRGFWDSDVGPSGFGQAIFPTAAARDTASNVTGVANETLINEDRYEFTLGNTLRGERPLLIHKVGGDLNRPGYLIEATKAGTDERSRVNWLKTTTEEILQRSGIDIART